MKNLTISIVLTIAFCIQSFAQQNQLCPTISIQGSNEAVLNPLTFTVTIDGMYSNKIGYLWTISKGKIIEGQGTASLKVSNEGLESVTATIEITGLPANCSTSSSASSDSDIGYWRFPSIKIDEFSSPPPQIRIDKIDRLLAELSAEPTSKPTSKGYILDMFKQNTPRIQVERKIKNLFKALISRKFPLERITLFVAKNKENLTEIGIIPVGSDAPIFEHSIRIDLQNYKKDLAKMFSVNQTKSGEKKSFRKIVRKD